MKQATKSILISHLAIFLLGLSGVFGKLLSLPSLIITLGRVLFSSIALFIYMLLKKESFKLNERKEYGYMFLLGILLAVHWASFYEAIQLSTVALGLLSFSTFPVFVTFLEPLFFKQKLKFGDVLLALIVFGGVAIAVPSFQLENTTTLGILIGIFSGLSYAFLSIFNKKFAASYSGTKVAFYEQTFAIPLLLPFLFVYQPVFTSQDILLLILLGVIFTGLAHSLFIGSLKHISTQMASIITCLEPLYAVLFAFILLREVPTLRDVISGIIILSAVCFASFRKARQAR